MNKIDFWKDQYNRYTTLEGHIIGRAQSLCIILGGQGVYILQNFKNAMFWYVILLSFAFAVFNALRTIKEDERAELPLGLIYLKDHKDAERESIKAYQELADDIKARYEKSTRTFHLGIIGVVCTFLLLLTQVTFGL